MSLLGKKGGLGSSLGGILTSTVTGAAKSLVEGALTTGIGKLLGPKKGSHPDTWPGVDPFGLLPGGRPPGLPALGGGGGGGMGMPREFLTPAPGAFAAAGGVPSGWHWAKDGSGRLVRNRRMNPCNPRAFRRAVRRIKGARKFAREVNKLFPTRRPGRVAPRGHRSRLSHR